MRILIYAAITVALAGGAVGAAGVLAPDGRARRWVCATACSATAWLGAGVLSQVVTAALSPGLYALVDPLAPTNCSTTIRSWVSAAAVVGGLHGARFLVQTLRAVPSEPPGDRGDSFN